MTKQNRAASNKDLLIYCSETWDRETGEGGKVKEKEEEELKG